MASIKEEETILGEITKMLPLTKDANLKNNLIKNAIIGFIVIFIGIFLFTVADRPSALTSKTYIYTFTILIPILIAAGIYFNFGKSSALVGSNMIILGLIIGLLVVIGGLFYLYSTMSTYTSYMVSAVINIILFLTIIIGLAILFKIFKNNIYKSDNSWYGFILAIIFYIPCLVSDFIEYILQQYKITPNIVFVLFIIEIILIICYIYVPMLINKVLVPKALVLQDTPIFLDAGEIVLSKSNDVLNPIDPNDLSALANIAENPGSEFNKNYCLSMWIYMNPQNTSNAAYANETTIFKYGSNNPKITYQYDSSKHLNNYTVYFSTGDNSKYTINAPSQKWNQFVINYNNNVADLFINGSLERSFPLDTLKSNYNHTDQITVGAANGLDGAICNVTYSKTPLSQRQIANSYNLFANKNPPTIKNV
jgi:hypothetical protein